MLWASTAGLHVPASVGQTKRRRADEPDNGSVGRPVVGGRVRPIVQNLTKCRRVDGPDNGSVSVVKCVWYCKHNDIAFVTTSPVSFCSSNVCDWLRCVLNTRQGGEERTLRPPVIRTTGRLARRHLVRYWTTTGRPTYPSSGPSARRLLVWPHFCML